MRKSFEEKFQRHVMPEPNSGCHLWSGAVCTSGYGDFHPDRKNRFLAHRWAYSHYVGPIPEGMCVCHKCDVKSCVNPDHLWLGTISDNNADMGDKGRSPFGERHWKSTLTREEVGEIRRLVATGMQLKEIARQFSIHPTHVSQIKRGVLRAKD